LFRQLADDQSLLVMAQSLWANVKELIIRSRQVLYYKNEPDALLHFIDIIENTIITQTRMASAKLLYINSWRNKTIAKKHERPHR
jgi:hypothetical protein